MNADLEIYLTRTSDTLLGLAVLSGRVDVGLLAGLSADSRREWGRKIARQLLRGDLDYSPPAPVVDEPDIPLLQENVGDESERDARRKINRYRADKAAGHVAKIGGIDRTLFRELAFDIADSLEKPDPWGGRDLVGSPIDRPHRSQDVAPPLPPLPDEVPGAGPSRLAAKP
jgi:hypothetical protein